VAPVTGAAERWAAELAAWEIPQEILDAAPESPWGFPASLFGHQAAMAASHGGAGRSRARAAEALPPGGAVLDVGSGGGAASLPLVPPAGRLVAVDQSEELLHSFAEAAGAAGVAHEEVVGTWPDVAGQVGPADVVVCHHVFYNVADLVPFAAALAAHARHRVVVEITAAHPQVALNHLWRELHGLDRPTGPTADDALAVLGDIGLHVEAEEWERPAFWSGVDRAERVAFARRRLCLGADRDPEIDALLDEGDDSHWERAVTLWWPGEA
jgi:precorrin-6B methylase 2